MVTTVSRKIMNTFLEKLQESGATDVILTSSGCAGLCNREPMITVEAQESAPVKYVNLDSEKAEKIFDEHIMKGTPVPDYALAVGSETTY
jgi:NADP-reducing hydrogenase subunit HndB